LYNKLAVRWRVVGYLGGAESTGQPILETHGDSIRKVILCFG
jgi:hypothetical protein